MNSFEKPLPPLDDGVLDLLTDGELSEAERRELLASLDRRPDGWRRCALAFLEAQCWKREFGEIRRNREAKTPPVAPARRQEGPPPRVQAAPAAAGRRRPFDLGRAGPLLAVAATFLIALGIGTRMRGPWQTDGEGGRAAVRAVRGGVGPQLSGTAQPAKSRDAWQMVTLAGSGGPNDELSIPAREGTRWEQRGEGEPFDAIPQDVFDALKRAGREIRHSRQYVPMRMDDGRRLVVPVDQVDVHCPAYQ